MNRDNTSQNPNRDPITGEPRSHPVGTGAGALGGGAAGAAAGSMAGPVGTGVGAAVGAIAGGLAGKTAGEHFNPTETGDLGRFIDYTVVDHEGDKIGTVDAVWEDHTGQPSYLAIRTGWLGLGKAHVVPAHSAEVTEISRKIRLPYSAEQVKSAPSFDSQADINADSEYTISSHFGLPTERARPDDGIQPPTRGKNDARMELKQEELKVGKREVEYGGIRLRKIVRTETVNQPVELQREEVVIERVPLDSTKSPTGSAEFSDEEIYIPLRREEAVVEKSVRAREEVRVGKRRETEQEHVTESVRREDVEIEQQGDARSDQPPRRL